MIRLQEYIPEEPRNTIRREISTISGEDLQRLNSVFRSCTECIWSGQQDFQHLFSIGEILLDFLKVIITANFFSLPSPTVKPPETRRMT
jgi:hypothetical protein